MAVSERYEDWKKRMEREGVPDPPAIFAGNWARKHIEELEAEVERLRQALAVIADDRTSHPQAFAQGALAQRADAR